MAKPTKKEKVDVEEAPVVVEEKVEKKSKKKQYHLVVKLNDQVFETDTNDIAESIKSFEPEILRTSLSVKVTNLESKTLDRFMYLNDAKRLFSDRIKMEMFIKNLIF